MRQVITKPVVSINRVIAGPHEEDDIEKLLKKRRERKARINKKNVRIA